MHLSHPKLGTLSEFPFGPGDPVRPICLPPQDTDEDYAGQTAVASGWGDTSQNSGSSDELQEIELTVRRSFTY